MTIAYTPLSEYLTEEQAAQQLGLSSARTLAERRNNPGLSFPPYLMLGRTALYDPAALAKWAYEQRVAERPGVSGSLFTAEAEG